MGPFAENPYRKREAAQREKPSAPLFVDFLM